MTGNLHEAPAKGGSSTGKAREAAAFEKQRSEIRTDPAFVKALLAAAVAGMILSVMKALLV